MTVLYSVIGSVTVALITLCGVIITNNKTQAVTETKLEDLTREVRALNEHASKVPVLEEKINNLTHRIYILEKERVD